jgi:hypothetical protein
VAPATESKLDNGGASTHESGVVDGGAATHSSVAKELWGLVFSYKYGSLATTAKILAAIVCHGWRSGNAEQK